MTEISPVDPATVHFTGENSFLRLKTDPASEEETTVCAHWRALISPGGPGTALFLRSDATDGEVRLYADNEDLARWLQELEAMLNPPFSDKSQAIVPATFRSEGSINGPWREIIESDDGIISMEWNDIGKPFMLRLQPDNDLTGPWGVYSCLTPTRAATLDVAGRKAQGAPYANALAGHPSSSCCLAWSETWVK